MTSYRSTAGGVSPLAALLGVALVVGPLAAQQRGDTFTDSIDVDVVNVDVVVTDKAGQPITGLTRGDFEIFEDGKPVQLTNFYAVDEAGASLGAARMPEDGAVVQPSRPPGTTQRLNLVIFVDNLNIRPENRKLLFEKLREELRSDVIPGNRVMLVAMNNRVEVIEPFTEDLDRIFAALDSIERQTSVHALLDSQRRMFMSRLARSDVGDYDCSRPRRPPPPPSGSGGTGGGGTGTGTGNGGGSRAISGNRGLLHAIRDAQNLALDVNRLGEQRYQAARGTVQSLQFFSDTLGGLPGRKALLYLSDGIPMRPAESLSEAWIAKYSFWLQQIKGCLGDGFAASDLQRAITGSGTHNLDLHSDFTRLTEKASDNRVAFYPISNHGRGSSFISAEVPGSTDGQSGTMIRGAMIAESHSRAASLLQMAEDTGGQALTGNANVGELLDRVRRDFSTFYSLGYALPVAKRDNAFHEIKVKVRCDGARVRHASGRKDKTWVDRLGDMTAAAALYELESNPLGIQLQRGEPVREGNRFKVPILVQIPLGQIQMASDGDKYKADLALLVVVRDSKGGFSPPRQFDLPIEIPTAQILQARQQSAGYPLELEMKKNARVVAISVRDNIGQTASVVKLDYDFGGGDEKKAKKKGKKG
ncbi:MAG: VWA domain-containing protein [bacterium]|nr:VWA domain-containing protein [bacterium]